jgi:hypothetical protein
VETSFITNRRAFNLRDAAPARDARPFVQQSDNVMAVATAAHPAEVPIMIGKGMSNGVPPEPEAEVSL